MNNLLVMIIAPWQLAVCLAIAVVLIALIITISVLAYQLKKLRQPEKLEQERMLLIEKLTVIEDRLLLDPNERYSGNVEIEVEVNGQNKEEPVPEPAPAPVEPAVNPVEEVPVMDIFAEDDSTNPLSKQILAVADMTPYMREKLGCVGLYYDPKRYYVRYSYGFNAKLRASSDEIKNRYTQFIDDVNSYKGVKIKESYKQLRIYKGRKTLALMLFKGKQIAVAFALDPKEFADTKYHGQDKSEVKKFADTPMLFKISSDRKLGYAQYLFSLVAAANELEKGEVTVGKYDMELKSRAWLFKEGIMRITILGEVLDTDVAYQPEMFGFNKPAQAQPVPVPAVEEPVNEENDDDEEQEEQEEQSGVFADEDDDDAVVTNPLSAEVLAVADMSEFMRNKLGFIGEEYDEKRYYVRYSYGFEAKLRCSDDEIKGRYVEIMNEINSYKGLKVKGSYKQQRVYVGRNTVALILFKGKNIALAYALDPKEFEETKFRGQDKSDKKKFESTPMLFKVSSPRKLGYAKTLLSLVAAKFELEQGEVVNGDYDLQLKSRTELYEDGAMRISVLGEVLDTDSLVYKRPTFSFMKQSVGGEQSEEVAATEITAEQPEQPAEAEQVEQVEEPAPEEVTEEQPEQTAEAEQVEQVEEPAPEEVTEEQPEQPAEAEQVEQVEEPAPEEVTEEQPELPAEAEQVEQVEEPAPEEVAEEQPEQPAEAEQVEQVEEPAPEEVTEEQPEQPAEAEQVEQVEEPAPEEVTGEQPEQTAEAEQVEQAEEPAPEEVTEEQPEQPAEAEQVEQVEEPAPEEVTEEQSEQPAENEEKTPKAKRVRKNVLPENRRKTRTTKSKSKN